MSKRLGDTENAHAPWLTSSSRVPKASTARRAISTSIRGGRSSARSSRTRTATTRVWAAAGTSRRRDASACCAPGSATSRSQTLAYGERIDDQRRDDVAAPGRPRARLGAGAHRARRRRCGSSPATTRSSPTRPARRSRRVRCDTFITESTFGLPIYRWQARGRYVRRHRRVVARQCRRGARERRLLLRVRQGAARARGLADAGALDRADRLPRRGRDAQRRVSRRPASRLPPTQRADDGADAAELRRALVLAPPSARGTPWLRRFGDCSDAFASGWMRLRGARRRRALDRGFVLSDHADWPGLQAAIAATGAQRVIVTHGRSPVDGALAAPSRARCAVRSRPSTTRTRPRPGGVKALRRALRRARRDDVDARQARGARALLRERRRRRRRVGGVLPRRRQAAPGGADAASARVRDRVRGAPARGCSRSATRRSATSPKPSRTCCRPPALHPTSGSPNGSERLRRAARRRSGATFASACSPYWDELDWSGRFLLQKLIGGGFRVGVSRLLVTRALAAHAGVDAKTHRATADRLHAHRRAARRGARSSRWSRPGRPARCANPGQPYPFFLAHQLTQTDRHARAIRATGWSNGNGTASARSSSRAAASAGCGRAARS